MHPLETFLIEDSVLSKLLIIDPDKIPIPIPKNKSLIRLINNSFALYLLLGNFFDAT